MRLFLCWVQTRSLAPAAVPNSLSYGYKAFTLPEFRGQGIYPAIAQREMSTCDSLGLNTGVSFTESRHRSQAHLLKGCYSGWHQHLAAKLAPEIPATFYKCYFYTFTGE